jgi:sugar phosphate isomerase/epimerase
MKLSFMTFASPTWTFQEVVDAAVRHGYHGIEFRCDATHAHGVEVSSDAQQRREIRDALEDAGVAPCCLATSLRFALESALEEAPARIDLAAEIGCPALRVFCGPPPEGLYAHDLHHRVAKHLREVAPRAQQAGVELWLETHDTFCRAADAAEAVRLADHPSIGINYDNMHPFRKGESVAATFAELSGLIRHTHFHDAINHPEQVVIKPLGEGQLPMDEMFEGLVTSGFAGYLSGEWFGTMYGEDPDASLERFKRDMETLAARHGVKLG